MLWNTGTLAEFRKWHAQMCLRLRPQGHENSVAFDVHCIVLEVFVCRVGSICVLLFGVKGTRTHEKAILKLPPESKDPKGRFQDTTGTNSYTILGVVFHSFSYFGVSWGVPGTGLEKDAEKVRNQTLQNLENCVPVYTGAQFSFSPRHLEIVDF